MITHNSPTLFALKVLLRKEIKRQKVSKAELARRINRDPRQVDRRLDLGHNSSMGGIDHAFLNLGKSVSVRVVKS